MFLVIVLLFVHIPWNFYMGIIWDLHVNVSLHG